jgi:hypothetical protein
VAKSKGITLPIIYKSDDAGLKKAGKQLDGFGKTVAKIGGAIAGAFAIKKIAGFASESVKVAEAAATAQARLEAVAEATGVFGDASQEVTNRLGEFAKSQEMRLATDDKVIKGVQAQLLTFKELSSTADEAGGTFDRVTVAALDMAAAGFGSAESNATALGKALEDPTKGLTALSRTGTVFTEQQTEQIKAMQAAGDIAGAQEMILGELESQYGGVAAATADASDQLAIAGENIKENFGAALLPVFNELVQGLLPVFETIGTTLGDTVADMQPMLEDLAGQIPGLLDAFIPLIPAIASIAGLFIELIAAALPFITDILDVLLPIIGELVPIIMDAISSAFEPLMDAFMVLADALLPLVAEFLPMFAEIIAVLAPLFADLVEQLAPMIAELLPPLLDLFMQLVEAFMPLVQELLPVIVDLMTRFAPIIVTLVEAFLPLIEMVLPIMIGLIELLVPILEWLAEIFSVILVGALDIFVGGIEAVTDGLSAFSDGFVATFEAIKDFFVGIINGMIGLFEGFINGIIGGINWLIGKINTLSIDVPATPFNDAFTMGFNFPKFSEVSIPRIALAEGGVVTGPTNALIGEAGPEAVIPLDKMGSMGGDTYNITVNAGMGTDGPDVAEQIVRMIRRYERNSGPVFARA